MSSATNEGNNNQLDLTPIQLPRTRITKATTSTTAVQPLEITTTAVVNYQPVQQRRNETRRKQSHHHHRHRIKSPVFQPDGSVSPLGSPMSSAGGGSTVVTPSINHDNVVIFSELPPPIIKEGPSEAIVALQDAVNATTTSTTTIPEETKETIDQLFESCFFSAVLLLQWSNVMGPKMEKVWSSSDEETATDEKLQTLIGRQVLNGEMGRSIMGVELKWITLHRQGILCASFLYNDKVSNSSNIFILPLRYLRNFSPYFHVLRDRVSPWLIEPLQLLRKLSRRRHIVSELEHKKKESVIMSFYILTTDNSFIISKMVISLGQQHWISLPIDVWHHLFDPL
ncbi:hypothetical protein BDC45DRAFT_442274 [Circinella umbellata]|nr:hypothetical protein BDC45DRAFT_442274 [Circinella umbellata]